MSSRAQHRTPEIHMRAVIEAAARRSDSVPRRALGTRVNGARNFSEAAILAARGARIERYGMREREREREEEVNFPRRAFLLTSPNYHKFYISYINLCIRDYMNEDKSDSLPAS